MGYTNWNNQAYQSRQTGRKKRGQSAFAYDKKVRKSGVKQVHPDMNPYGKVRESRDSAAHPDSLAIAVMFDVTGSMGRVPRVLQKKLGSLMRVLIEKGYVDHPQVLFGAIGDAWCDRVPLQVGQFESGLEMDDDLGKIYLEGGGGGQVHESYELAMYYFAHYTKIDCYEKRGRKGYLFTMGDEKPYPFVRKEQLMTLLGKSPEVDVPIEQAIAELQKRYHYFHIVPTCVGHGGRTEVQDRWRELLGEHMLLLDDEAAVTETIALTIGLNEGTIDELYAGSNDLINAGHDPEATAYAVSSVSRFAKSRMLVPVAAGVLPAASGGYRSGRL